MTLRPLIHGILSFRPRFRSTDSAGGGDSQSARYCYSVWLRHLTLAHTNGLQAMPETIAELGPGNSLGVGLCALLSGAEQCFAFDVVEHTDLAANLEILDELIALFRAREPIPDEIEFPHVKPYLDDYSFPCGILTDTVLNQALEPGRVQAIRDALRTGGGKDSRIQYKVPWLNTDIVESESVDMIFSQAVLEHVDELEETYAAMSRWLRTGGLMSHQIDFRCHGTAEQWNGHWRYPNWIWWLIRGRRHHLINRMPISVHRALLEGAGFKLLCQKKVHSPSDYSTAQLARPFRKLTPEDLETSGAFLQAIKR
jgi:SAM-dependent methyltransferase